jgi:exonuclease I
MVSDKQKITHITMLSQILMNRLSDKIAENNFSKGLKYSAKTFVKQLEEVERKRFDKFDLHDQESTNQLYIGIDNFYSKVSEVEIQNMDSAFYLLELLNKYPAELEQSINELITKLEIKNESN